MVPRIVAALAVVAPTLWVTPVLADDTGFAYAHDLRRERGKLCFRDHWHYGSGTGKSKKAARISAIRSWAQFTALEYGTDWARFSRASGKSIKCLPAGGGAWDCQIDARPCK